MKQETTFLSDRSADALLETSSWPVVLVYAMATISIVAPFGLMYALGERHDGTFYLLLLPFIIATVTLFGSGPGIWATGLAALLVAYFVLEPAGFAIGDPNDAFELVLFVTIGLASSVLIAILRTRWRMALRDLALTQTAARDRDVRLRELMHRIRNDFSLLLAILRMQQRSLTDPDARAALEAVERRIQVLGRVHNRLEQQGPEAVADTREFIEGLCDDLRMSLVELRPVVVRVKAESHLLPLSSAVGVGLIINELLTNALKYAFPDNRSGCLSVSFAREGYAFRLVVADDGVGVGAAPGSGTGLGQRLTLSLAAQLQGHLAWDRTETGTVATLRFPVERRALSDPFDSPSLPRPTPGSRASTGYP